MFLETKLNFWIEEMEVLWRFERGLQISRSLPLCLDSCATGGECVDQIRSGRVLKTSARRVASLVVEIICVQSEIC